MRRLQLLFVVALLGVLAVLGAVLSRLGGWPLTAGYFVVALVLLAVAASRARVQQAAARTGAGRTCTCCSGTVHDPVQVR